MGIVAIEEKLDELFESAIGVDDTIWYTETETLRDAIMDMIESELQAGIPRDSGRSLTAPVRAGWGLEAKA